MLRHFGLVILALAFFSAASAHAAPAQQAPADPFKQPDLVSFGGSYMNFDKTESHRQAADFRFEYRWGLSMLPLISPWFKSWDEYVQFHPFAGVETTSLGALYGLGGWAMDWKFLHHGVFTWSEGVGLFYNGDMRPMGSVLQFRSQGELGWVFDNQMRMTAQISHISDAKITQRNPGAEIVGVYFHVPISAFCAN
jgi:hypothetical protein